MMTISKQTGNFVDCMRIMQNLYTKVYESLEEIYKADDVERILSDQFVTEFDALEKQIESLVIMSIKERMSNVGLQEI